MVRSTLGIGGRNHAESCDLIFGTGRAVSPLWGRLEGVSGSCVWTVLLEASGQKICILGLFLADDNFPISSQFSHENLGLSSHPGTENMA